MKQKEKQKEETVNDNVVYGTWHDGNLYLRKPLFLAVVTNLGVSIEQVFGREALNNDERRR